MRLISPSWMEWITDTMPGLKWPHPLAADFDGNAVSWLPSPSQLPSQKSNGISSITFYSNADSLAENVWASEWRNPATWAQCAFLSVSMSVSVQESAATFYCCLSHLKPTEAAAAAIRRIDVETSYGFLYTLRKSRDPENKK